MSPKPTLTASLVVAALLTAWSLPAHGEKCMILAVFQEEEPQMAQHLKTISIIMKDLKVCTVLSPVEARQRIANAPIPDPNTDIRALSNVVDAGQFDYNNSDYERAIRRLTEAIDSLQTKAPFSEKRTHELEHARLYLARSYLVLGKEKETIATYQDILRANPSFALDPARYSRKERSIFDDAKAALEKQPKGSLDVLSSPAGAQVFLDGRMMGKTPLSITDTIWPGEYHILVKKGQVESLPRIITIQKGVPARLNIDLDLESRIRPWKGPGLHLNGRKWDLQGIVRLGGMVGVDLVVAASLVVEEGQRYLMATLLEVNSVRERRSGRVPLETSNDVDPKILGSLIQFLFTGQDNEQVAQVRFEGGQPVAVVKPKSPTTTPPGGTGEEPPPPTASTPWYASWWFWTAVGVVVAGGVTAGVLVGTGGEEASPGSLGKVTAPLVSF